jgi:hypothetical protein
MRAQEDGECGSSRKKISCPRDAPRLGAINGRKEREKARTVPLGKYSELGIGVEAAFGEPDEHTRVRLCWPAYSRVRAAKAVGRKKDARRAEEWAAALRLRKLMSVELRETGKAGDPARDPARDPTPLLGSARLACERKAPRE